MSAADFRRRQVRTLVFVLVCAGVLAAAAIVLNAVTWVRLNDNIDNLRRARLMVLDWNVAISLVKDIEVGQRGFLLTNDENFLTPYEVAVEKLPSHWEKLRARQTADAGYSGRVVMAQELAGQVTDFARETVTLARHGRLQVAQRLVADERGKNAMDRLRNLLDAELILLNQTIQDRTSLMKSDLQAGLISSIAIGLMALGIGGIAMILIRRILQEMRRSDRYAIEKDRAEDARQQKSSFLAMMSHEIRTPLNAILGFGDLVMDEAKTPTLRRYAESIVTAGRALLQLLNDVLDLSKLDAGMMELQPGPVDVRELVEFSERLFRENAAKKNITLTSDIQTDLPTSLLLDETRLRQILLNLVGNAVKFTEQGKVTLRVEGSPSERDQSRWSLRFSVRDTGPGISEEGQEKIFQPFVQSPQDERTTATGTGLGLAIVQRFVLLMGGTVKVASAAGEGSTFTVDLPDVAVSNRLPLQAAVEHVAVDFNLLAQAKIVVADDNQTNIELLREIFRGSHHEIFAASNGLEALQVIEDVEPQIVLMDIRMPVMDGEEALKTLRSNFQFKLMPVIAVTASSRANEFQPNLAGFDGSLRKPFSRSDLYAQMALFLPAYKPSTTPSPAFVPQNPAQWSILIARLREWESTDWLGLREGMVLSEIAAFAEKIRLEAAASDCPPATEYATELKHAVESFEFLKLNTLVLAFPDLIQRIVHSIHSNP